MVLDDILIFPNLTFTRASILWISSSITCVRVHIPCCQEMAAMLQEPGSSVMTPGTCYYHVPLRVPTSYITLPCHSVILILWLRCQTHKYFPQHDSYFPTSCWPLHWHRKSTQTTYTNKFPILRSCRDCLICFNSQVCLKCPWLPLLSTGINFIDDANLNLCFLSK